uniref:DUF659 domain-containing protein n=1 Tax=Amphimedon queenslandica TaxID=400682 RepID=A0A1X7TKC3_AMPQE
MSSYIGNWTNKKKTSSSYVQHSSNRKYGTILYQYLYCNRSGKIRLRGEGKKHLKTQGSSKIDAPCIANMKVMTDTVTGSVTVEYCSTHTGHLLELAHLPISSELRLNIAAKLHDGVPVDVILDSISDSMPNGKTSRHRMILDDALVNMIVTDLQPASIVEDDGFLKFLKVLDPKYIPPSRRTIMRDRLPRLYAKKEQEVRGILDQSKWCTITTDLWTSRAPWGT